MLVTRKRQLLLPYKRQKQEELNSGYQLAACSGHFLLIKNITNLTINIHFVDPEPGLSQSSSIPRTFISNDVIKERVFKTYPNRIS